MNFFKFTEHKNGIFLINKIKLYNEKIYFFVFVSRNILAYVQNVGKRSSAVLPAPKYVRVKICKTPIVIQSASSRPVSKPKPQYALIPTEQIIEIYTHNPISRNQEIVTAATTQYGSKSHMPYKSSPQNLLPPRPNSPPKIPPPVIRNNLNNSHHSQTQYQYFNSKAQIQNHAPVLLPAPQLPPPPPPQHPPAIPFHFKSTNQSLLMTTLMNNSFNNNSHNVSHNTSLFNNTGPVMADQQTQSHHNGSIQSKYHKLLEQSALYTLFEKQPPPPYPGTKVIHYSFNITLAS
jgi:hypothetical protein